MAIIDCFKVSISVNGRDLNEFPYNKDESESDAVQIEGGTKKIRRYIEAAEGEEFVVNLSITGAYLLPAEANTVIWKFLLDGKRVMSRLYYEKNASQLKASQLSIYGVTHCRGTTHVRHNFKFKHIEITSETPNAKSLEQYIAKGTIEIHVWPHCREGSSTYSRLLPINDDLNLPEKAAKGRAVTLGTGFGSEHIVATQSYSKGRKIGIEPIAKFVFEYRTKEALKQLMVIPRTPSPEPEAPLAERDPASLTAQEIRQLQEELKALKRIELKKEAGMKEETTNRKAGIKREFVTDDNEIQVVHKKAKQTPEHEIIVLD